MGLCSSAAGAGGHPVQAHETPTSGTATPRSQDASSAAGSEASRQAPKTLLPGSGPAPPQKAGPTSLPVAKGPSIEAEVEHTPSILRSPASPGSGKQRRPARAVTFGVAETRQS